MPNGDLHIDFRKAEVADTVRYPYLLFLKCLKEYYGRYVESMPEST